MANLADSRSHTFVFASFILSQERNEGLDHGGQKKSQANSIQINSDILLSIAERMVATGS